MNSSRKIGADLTLELLTASLKEFEAEVAEEKAKKESSVPEAYLNVQADIENQLNGLPTPEFGPAPGIPVEQVLGTPPNFSPPLPPRNLNNEPITIIDTKELIPPGFTKPHPRYNPDEDAKTASTLTSDEAVFREATAALVAAGAMRPSAIIEPITPPPAADIVIPIAPEQSPVEASEIRRRPTPKEEQSAVSTVTSDRTIVRRRYRSTTVPGFFSSTVVDLGPDNFKQTLKQLKQAEVNFKNLTYGLIISAIAICIGIPTLNGLAFGGREMANKLQNTSSTEATTLNLAFNYGIESANMIAFLIAAGLLIASLRALSQWDEAAQNLRRLDDNQERVRPTHPRSN